MASESDGDEVITVEDDEMTRGASSGGTSSTTEAAATPIPATKTAADGTIRARLTPRQRQQASAAPPAGAACCGGGEAAPTAAGGCSAVGAFCRVVNLPFHFVWALFLTVRIRP